MKFSIAPLCSKAVAFLGCAAFAFATITSLSAQKPEARIHAPIDNATRSTLAGTRPAMSGSDVGRLAATTRLEQMTVEFSLSAAQQTELDTLIVDQQNSASPKYHQWLSPDVFGAMFGAADSDIAKVRQWLQSQGFSAGDVSRNRREIAFSGTVGQVEAAFGTEMHTFRDGGETHFAPANDLSVPAALAAAVSGVGHLNDMKPRSHRLTVPPSPSSVHANFTSGQSGNNFVQPGDLAVIYDIKPAYSAGYTGVGQTIVVIGQSAVVTSDITNFQTAAGLTPRTPTITLMPNTGVSTLTTGDESESDLDLEWTGAVATGATINFVYTGNAANTGGAFSALQYAITNGLGNIISSSYGNCEIAIGSAYFTSATTFLQQAAAQGQTVISASGDTGSTDCSRNTNLGTANQEALSVDFPADSQYVTAMGGTEYPSADVASGGTVGASAGTYWTSVTGTDVLTSAKSYIPEQAWNDDSPTTLSSGGGGVSTLAPRPSWQTGIGITPGSFRMVPDISLASSPYNAGYLYCSSDTAGTGVTGSCSHGFRDVNNTTLTIAGGTSFAAPIFAGMLAIINQRTNTPSAGLINPTLYTLASNATTYASAFHDITSGTNACTGGTSLCGTGPQTSSYAAGTGYDMATGLGSIDLFNLMQAWNLLQSTTITATAATTPAVSGSTDTITVKVVPSAATTPVPTGTVSVYLDGGSTSAATLTLSGGTASYAYPSQATLGAHTLKFIYSGDTNYPAPTTPTSTILTLSVKSPGAFSISAPGVSVTHGSTTTETLTVTPTGGYFGLTNFTLSPATIVNACYSVTNPTITGTAAAQVAVTINTNSTNCAAQNLIQKGSGKLASSAPPPHPGSPLPAGLALAGLALAGFFGGRSRKLRGVIFLAFLTVMGLGISGCGSTSTAGAGISTTAPAGAYTVTVTGTDAVSGTITASTTFTLTIQ